MTSRWSAAVIPSGAAIAHGLHSRIDSIPTSRRLRFMRQPSDIAAPGPPGSLRASEGETAPRAGSSRPANGSETDVQDQLDRVTHAGRFRGAGESPDLLQGAGELNVGVGGDVQRQPDAIRFLRASPERGAMP